MVRSVDYDTRRREILNAAINKYIEGALPVASEDIAEDFALSPATIRSVFAQLEQDGYLMHPYTSGGRIPTNKGYRCYVDLLLSRMELLEVDKRRVISEYKKEINRLEDVLEKTSEIISMITRYAGIACFLERQDRFLYRGISYILEQPEFHDAGKIRLIIKMLEEKQQLLDVINRDFEGSVKVYIGEEIGYPEIVDCSLVVSVCKIKDKPLGRLAVLGPKRMEYRQAIPALEYISGVLTDILSGL